MPVTVEVSLDEQSMIDYMMHTIYTKGVGVFSIVLGILNIGLVFAFFMRKEYPQMLLFAAFAVIVLLVFPYLLKRNMSKTIKDNKRISTPVTYEFSDEGIVTTTGGKRGKASWKAFKKARSKKRIIMLFDAKKQSIILPVDQLGDHYTQIVDLIFNNMPAPDVRINRLDKKKG
ncbi:MAG TPA: YcxB family protein [Candidatus Dorea intestinavium]|nr:YcxB family protein [Candidatus Dorea intestinavium]